jgi:hypothetical protein
MHSLDTGEYTKISNFGRGAGRSGISDGSSLNEMYVLGCPSASGW